MKPFHLLFAALAISPSLFAQNDLGKADDAARIALHAYVPDNVAGMPAGATEYLRNKLHQIATAQGLGGAFQQDVARILRYFRLQSAHHAGQR